MLAISASLWVLELSQNTPFPNTPKRSTVRRQRVAKMQKTQYGGSGGGKETASLSLERSGGEKAR